MKSILISLLITLCISSISSRPDKIFQTKYPLIKRSPNKLICKSIHEVLNGTSTLCFVDQFKSNSAAKKICEKNHMKLINFEAPKTYNVEKSATIESQIFDEWKSWVMPYFKRKNSPHFWITERKEKLKKCSAIYYGVTNFKVRERLCGAEFKFFCQFESKK